MWRRAILFLLGVTIFAIDALSAQNSWEDYKHKFNKVYDNIVDDKVRLEVFEENLKIIEEHNLRYKAGLETYYMEVNQFADLTPEEFNEMLGLQVKVTPYIKRGTHVENRTEPDSIDWRSKGAVMGVKNQKDCKSSWAFSAIGAIEGQYAIRKKIKIALSEQQLLDCTGSYGNGDCKEGGDIVAAFKYAKDHGIHTESAYPYKAERNFCSSQSGLYKIRAFSMVAANENALKNAVGTVGPISAAIYAEPLQFYKGGIFKSSACYNDKKHLDHAVLVVGYGTSPLDYWIIKNSWGESWGEEGYLRLARNASQCGIALGASYPILELYTHTAPKFLHPHGYLKT